MNILNILKLSGGFLFRWVGFPVEPKLLKIGKPDENSPVLLTSNFNITVNRVIKALKNIDCWLLIAPSNGINVWCGACGDDFLTSSVLSILKLSDIGNKVNHRRLILPQLSACGLDPIEIKEKTGWNVKFGPVYAKDIPEYLKNNFQKSKSQREVSFPILARLEMASMYFSMLAIILSIIYGFCAIFIDKLDWFVYLDMICLCALMNYGALFSVPYFKLKTGRRKIVVFEALIIGFILLFYFFIWSDVFVLIWNLILSLLFAMVLSEDLHGLTPIYKSELGNANWKKGKKTMNFIIAEYKLNPYGTISINRESCIGCGVCFDVCPRNVYEMNKSDKKVDLVHPEKCINCNACVHRCIVKCLIILPD
ncbi:MAG: HgcAB-like fusion protein [Promethearchaeota archaeon]